MRTRMSAVLALGLAVAGQLATAPQASAQQTYQNSPYYTGYQLNRYFYYPYAYFPHNYWPVMTPRWPEPAGAPYMQPPAYMANPPFRQPNWRATTCGSRCATIVARTFGWISFEASGAASARRVRYAGALRGGSLPW